MTKDDQITHSAAGATPTGRQAFSFDQMVTCAECLRANPPTRTACLYCSAPMPGAGKVDESKSSQISVAATTNNGFNVVLLPSKSRNLTGDLSQLAALFRLKEDELVALVRSGEALPVFCASTLAGAGELGKSLRIAGFECLIVADENLNLDCAPQKTRALEILDDCLIGVATNGRRRISMPWEEIVLIVAGRLNVNRVEIEQPQSRRKQKPAVRRELSEDDAVLDLCTRREESWRIVAKNFDFSCLGEARSMLASENIGLLAESLSRRSKVHFDNSYNRVRRMLDSVWPIEPQTEKSMRRRAGTGEFSTISATIHDNDAQFTRYARLRQHLRARELEKS